MAYGLKFDKPTAIRAAQLLEQDGDLESAWSVWWQLSGHDPYDWPARENVADLWYTMHQGMLPPPGVERSRALLHTIRVSTPTTTLTGAYFEGLRQALADRPQRAAPGKLIVALGSGRCGTTTLAGMLARLPDACATHENPPLVNWDPLDAQLRFHISRFRLLLAHYAVVFDAAYWWLTSAERLLGEFPEARLIGLVRETGPCVESFMKQKGSGRGSLNHWVPPGNGIWRTTPADPCFPTYPLPETAQADPDGAKGVLLSRFVSEYNERLKQMAAADPTHVLLVRTEDLNSTETSARLSEFLGIAIGPPRRTLNVGTTADGHQSEWMF